MNGGAENSDGDGSAKIKLKGQCEEVPEVSNPQCS